MTATEKVIDAAHLQEELAAVLADLAKDGAPYVIVRDGRPVAAVIGHDDFLRWQAYRQDVLERFDHTWARLAERNAHFSDEEVARDVEEAIAEVRREQR